MNHPTPAIVAQSAVRPLPRWALLLLCLAYAVPGFVGRAPWRSDDLASFGYMRELALGHTDWLHPLLAGLPGDGDGLLHYWLGAWALQALGGWLPLELAARVPFVALLLLTLSATWYGVYYLARGRGAQPVAFAFGGEAQPADYARAMADGALLALIACLGLAQLSHETTGYLTQLACTALLFFAGAALPWRMAWPLLAGLAGLLGLVFSGAPTLAVLLGLGSAWLIWRSSDAPPRTRAAAVTLVLLLTLAATVLALRLDLWRWRIVGLDSAKDWQSLLRLLVWFSWPAWPLALWTLWRWRHLIADRQWHRHLWLPLWFALVTLGATLTTRPADRALLLSLPALAALAAFALPTLRRSIAALIDWFTLLFFSVSAITIWVIWLSVQTGVPAKPAANVAKLAPGYLPSFSAWPFAVALAATLAWCLLVAWRTARNRPAIWKSLVLPAGGATLGWLLLMTLWLPMLDYGRSLEPQVAGVRAVITERQGCVAAYGLSRAQVAGLMHHGQLPMVDPSQLPQCDWMVADPDESPSVVTVLPPGQWTEVGTISRPTDRNDRMLVLRRQGAEH
ncbi:hypothetical protein [Alicycliphilus denitrificans]|uniref:hypothetical protein n=1 Tax=Alicycliphilus denitrificans TaxID=179636 RepID=UPI00384FD20A